jgi:hypothetical protein
MFARLLREWRRDQQDNVKALNIVTAVEGGWTDEELASPAEYEAIHHNDRRKTA